MVLWCVDVVVWGGCCWGISSAASQLPLVQLRGDLTQHRTPEPLGLRVGQVVVAGLLAVRHERRFRVTRRWVGCKCGIVRWWGGVDAWVRSLVGWFRWLRPIILIWVG